MLFYHLTKFGWHRFKTEEMYSEHTYIQKVNFIYDSWWFSPIHSFIKFNSVWWNSMYSQYTAVIFQWSRSLVPCPPLPRIIFHDSKSLWEIRIYEMIHCCATEATIANLSSRHTRTHTRTPTRAHLCMNTLYSQIWAWNVYLST